MSIAEQTPANESSSRGATELAPRRADVAARRINKLATLLDDAFTIPGTSRRVGWDGLIGLVPGVGDTATAAASLYIVYEAARAGVPKRVLVGMLGRLGVDTLIGVIPVVGDLFDFAFKANRRNAATALKHIERLS